MKKVRKICSIDNQNYLVDTDKHRIYDVETIGALNNGYRIFSCLIDDVDNDIVSKVRKWGCVNENYEEVIPCRYARLSESRRGVFNATMLNPTSIGGYSDKHFFFLVDEKGVPIYFRHIEDNGVKRELLIRFEGFVAISEFKEGLAIGLSLNNKQGVLRSDGSLLLEPQYDYIYLNVHERYISARKGNDYRTVLYFEGEKCWRFVPQGYLFKKFSKEEKHFILSYEKKVAVMDFNGNLIVPPIYKELVFCKYYIKATDDDGKIGALEKTNPQNILINFEYAKIETYSTRWYPTKIYDGYLKVVKNRKQGVYSLKEKRLIIPVCIKDDVDLMLHTLGENLIGFYDSSIGNGFMDIEGNIAFTFYGSIMRGFKDGIACISSKNKWTEIDKSGNIVREGEFERNEAYEVDCEEVTYTEEDVWDAMTDGMYGDYSGGDIDYDALGF